MRKILLYILLAVSNIQLYAQKATISGMVTDSESGESLLSANVYNKESHTGTVTNNFGFFNLTLSKGRNIIVCSYTGYNTREIELILRKDTIIHFQLVPVIELEEVTITDRGPKHDVTSTMMDVIDLPVLKTKSMPVLLGEVDIIKSLQLMPGVSGGIEGSSGLYVRGGGPDQNLILLDGVPVYNANHLFGFFSVFNADAIKSVTLIKGGFPARYGGRLSSVIDIRMKDGNMKKFGGEASIGLLSSKAMIEGPIIKDRTSFIVTGRRTYLDALTYPFQILGNMINNGAGYKSFAGAYFYDVNAKVNHIFNDRNRLYISGYFGKDKFFSKSEYRYESPGELIYEHFTNEDDLLWGNATASLRWNHIFSPRMFSNMDFTFSNYKLSTGSFYELISSKDTTIQTESQIANYYSRIRDYGFKYQFEYRPAEKHLMRFGISNTLHYFSPGVGMEKHHTYESTSDIDSTYGELNLPANEFYAYMEDDFDLTRRLGINLGMHYSNFYVRDTLYHSIEPRISIRYLITDDISVKAGYIWMTQYLHLLTNSTIGLPTDLWIPATDLLDPQKSWQASIGAVYQIKNNYELSIEGYYKDMWNLTEYSEGASFTNVDDNWESVIEQGNGRSFGIEFLFQKTQGNTTGWIGYTLSKTDRQFENISFGRVFPYKYDRRHDISVVVTHKFNERIDIGCTWVFATGNAFTLGDEFYVSNETYENILDPDRLSPFAPESPVKFNSYFKYRNSYRMPDYHRLDLGVNFHKQRKVFYTTFSLGIYNVYAHQNPIYVKETISFNEETLRWEPALKQLSILTFIPYFRYSVKF